MNTKSLLIAVAHKARGTHGAVFPTPSSKGFDMNLTRTIGSLLLLAAFGTTAQAQLTRHQVKAELAEATRAGDMAAGGESGLKLYELTPGRYPAKPMVAGKTREQVMAELGEATRTGDMAAGGESGLNLYELTPGRYPAKPMVAGKMREQVMAELAEATRTGDMAVGGESGLKLYELFPERYAKARDSLNAGKPQAPAATAGAATVLTH